MECIAAGVTAAAADAGFSFRMRAKSSRTLQRKVLHWDLDDREMLTGASVPLCEGPQLASCFAETAARSSLLS